MGCTAMVQPQFFSKMANKKKQTPSSTETPEPIVKPTEQQIAFVKTNHPDLSPEEFKLGDRTFKIVALKYKDNIRLMSYMTPLLNVIGDLSSKNVELPDLELGQSVDLSKLISYCSDELPKMVAVIAQATDETVTAQWVEDNATDPFQLANVVIKYLAVSSMIGHVLDFFARTLPSVAKEMKTRKSPAA